VVEDCHRPGNWGNKKLVKNNQDNKIQSVTLCNAQLALGHSPRSWGIFKNFCVKNNLTVCKVTFNCELQKKMGKQDVLVAAPIILLGEQRALPAPPVPATMKTVPEVRSGSGKACMNIFPQRWLSRKIFHHGKKCGRD